jgi:hypothetical protein
MKFFISLLLIVFTTNGFAQSFDKNTIRFEYIQRPLKPLDRSIRNYQVTVIPPAPVFPPPFTLKPINTNELASMIKLEGYTLSPSTSARITLTIMAYEMQQTLVKVDVTQSEKGKTVTVPKFHYEIVSRQPIGLMVQAPDGTVLIQETPPVMLENSKSITNDFNSQAELDAWWTSNRDPFLSNNQYSTLFSNMRNMNNVINDYCGFPIKMHATELILVTSKKVDYKDYQDAYDVCLKGYKLLATSRQEGVNNILSAIGIWENALRESNVTDKKARINEDVTVWTLINLGEAYAWIDNFAKANECVASIYKMELGRKEHKRLEKLDALIKSLQATYAANNR